MSFTASKIRVCISSAVGVDETMAELELHRRAFRVNFRADHEHVEWHDNTFGINLVASKCKYASQREGNIDHLSSKGLQAKIHQELAAFKYSTRVWELLRKRLGRWKLDIPGRLVERVMRRILELGGKVSPSVHTVYIRTLLNGWVTARRMSSLADSGLMHECVLCGKCCVSIAHRHSCTHVRTFFTENHVGLSGLSSFFGLLQGQFPECTPTIAKLISAFYLARNAVMHAPASFFDVGYLIRLIYRQIS